MNRGTKKEKNTERNIGIDLKMGDGKQRQNNPFFSSKSRYLKCSKKSKKDVHCTMG